MWLPNPDVFVSYFEAVAEAIAGKGALIARGCYAAAPPMGGKHKGAAAGLSPTYSFQAYIVRAAVDLETGVPTVRKVWAAHDCGRHATGYGTGALCPERASPPNSSGSRK